jgi:hypothetical protein
MASIKVMMSQKKSLLFLGSMAMGRRFITAHTKQLASLFVL